MNPAGDVLGLGKPVDSGARVDAEAKDEAASAAARHEEVHGHGGPAQSLEDGPGISDGSSTKST